MSEVLHEKERLAWFVYMASNIFCCEVPGANHYLLEIMRGADSKVRHALAPETVAEDVPLADEIGRPPPPPRPLPPPAILQQHSPRKLPIMTL